MRRDAVVRRHPHALDTSVIEMCDAAVSLYALCVRVRAARGGHIQNPCVFYTAVRREKPAWVTDP
jgi:hypothetical protein